MKLTTGILACAVMAGSALAQNPSIIDKVSGTMKSVQQTKTDDSNAALAAAGVQGQDPAKPAKSAPGAAVKPKPGTSVAVQGQLPAPHATVVSKHLPPKKGVNAPVPVVSNVLAQNTGRVDAARTEQALAPTPAKLEDKKAEEKKWAMTGKRDPFFSPVVAQVGGSGCSTGKKCLEIGQINVRGVVKSDSGFIAVVTNTLNKAYFLRENDPVYNGYVQKITGDSVVFHETVQDKLGKPFSREVVKKISTPAV
jgi:hypothetical protein